MQIGNMIVIVVVSSLSSLGACTKSSSSDAPASSQAGSGAVTSVSSVMALSAGSTPPVTNASGSMSCANLLPDSVRDKYMAGMTLKESGSRSSHSCNFQDPSNPTKQVLVSYDCSRHVDDAGMKVALEAVKGLDPKTGKDVPSLGRGAAEVKAMGVSWQIHVYDDKTPCRVVVGFGTTPPDNRVDTARAVLGSLTRDSIK